MAQRLDLFGADRSAGSREGGYVRGEKITRRSLDDGKDYKRVDQQQKRQQKQALGDVIRHRSSLPLDHVTTGLVPQRPECDDGEPLCRQKYVTATQRKTARCVRCRDSA